MNPLQMEPPRSPGKPPRKQGNVLSPAQWLKQSVLASPDSTITSLGEFLLPSLLGAMEASWIAAVLIGLASASMFGSPTPLLPFWAPFVFIIGTQWFFYTVDRRGENAQHASENEQASGSGKLNIPAAPLFFILAGLLCLFIIWLQVYARQGAAIFDLRWLATLFNDILFLNSDFYQVVFIIALSFILCWRGLRLASRTIEPSTIFRELCLGIIVMIVITALRAELTSAGVAVRDDVILFLLIPLFLYLSLAAHALARIAFVRRSHSTGLQGSVVAQERAVLTVIGLLGAILLVITVITGIFASPTFFSSSLHILAPLGAAIVNVYNWLIGLLAYIAVIIITPFFWLFSLLVPAKPRSQPNSAPKFVKQNSQPQHIPPATFPVLLLVFKILVPVVILLVVVLLMRRAMRRREKMHVRGRQRDEDFHESLWSWSLFWSQLKAILRAIFGRFLPRPAAGGVAQVAPVGASGGLAARDIRAIYRAFLMKAASRGFTRKKDETPDELRQRLDEKAPLVEPQLEEITGAYTLVRYGESILNASDVAAIQGQWSELDQKWV